MQEIVHKPDDDATGGLVVQRAHVATEQRVRATCHRSEQSEPVLWVNHDCREHTRALLARAQHETVPRVEHRIHHVASAREVHLRPRNAHESY